MPRLADLPKPSIPGCVLDHAGVLAVLPHRHPFLFVDRLLEFEEGKRAVGLKLASFGEPHFVGHFPADPVMPGVIQIEALAQVATILVMLSHDVEGKRPAFLGIDKARFRRAVRPGDSLRLEVELVSFRRNMATVQSRILVDGQVSCEAELMATMV
ncbi:MAG TPA: 3-hydroxyacyl-ACP dehydratase FabZ [Fibrobacteria bacterium]|nr:3-hydroxyacyl-ACP dehydratase FabZ [Fibrobacteria bacterium]HOX52553.1 3-hydroxyacyl-ACP dehydratase FabZ [Fibrobacteria bacterium]